MINLGLFQRPYLVRYRWMPRENASRSLSTPKKSSGFALSTGRESPVVTASRNTRSVLSSNVSWLETTRKGGPEIVSGIDASTFTGPNDPMCSHMVELPGPPLNRKVTGRGRPFALGIVYAV